MLARPTQTESGFTLLEMLFVVGTAAIMMLGITVMVNNMNTTRQIADAERLLSKISMEAGAYKTLTGSYSNLACNLWNSSSVNCLLVQNGTLQARQMNIFKGRISIVDRGATSQFLTVALDNVRPASCEKLLLAANDKKNLVQLDVYAGLQDIVAATAGVAPPPGCTAPSGGCNTDGTFYDHTVLGNFPIKAATAAQVCSGGSRYTLAWMFNN